MEFTLVYRGPLKSNGSIAQKQTIRREIHSQLSVLWMQQPLKNLSGQWLTDNPSNDATLIRRIGPFRIAPLVSPSLHQIAELSITFLRPEAPGSLITQGGDIDNRIKTLLDALRMPKNMGEMPPGETPQTGEDPFFCLLEDDNLVTHLAVKTDRLLENVEASQVQLLIHVRTRATQISFAALSIS